jgi:hypothetical protein
MKFLTEDAIIVCNHEVGRVRLRPTQDLVTVEGRRLLVGDNPENRPISRCPNIGATIRPCLHTLRVQQGYSEWLRVQGQRICLDTVTGLTDGTPPGTVVYKVNNPGQQLVSELA